jgi:hypothetical protein
VVFKKTLIKIHWFFSSQLGLDPIRFFHSFYRIPSFLNDWYHFRKEYSGKFTLKPCLHDSSAAAGVTKGEYFWQDLLIAKWIYEANPNKHVDIGSRIDGFIAHVAAFREIEVFDVRPISTIVPNVVFKQADLMDETSIQLHGEGYCDSISCLHALEHFGLGRYGDPIDSNGYEKGFTNMTKFLKPGGRFYLSTPIGKERVEFNSHRVFNPHTIINIAKKNGLILQNLTIINNNGFLEYKQPFGECIKDLEMSFYNLTIFTFIKITEGEI